MNKKFKLFIPPILFIAYHKLFPKKKVIKTWTGNYKSWEDAKLNSTGYDTDIILEKCKSALLKVKNGKTVYERDSVLFDEIQYSWALLAGLQKAAIENNGNLSVLDFGGSLGSTYYQNKDFLNLENLDWNIVEQKHFVDCGKEHFENQQLKFYYTIDDCFKEKKPTILLLSSVLQYLENPYQWIETFIKYNFDYIIIDRTAFIETIDDKLTIQTVPTKIYKASYPAWFFNKKKIITSFNGYKNIANISGSFTSSETLDKTKVSWTGFILKKVK